MQNNGMSIFLCLTFLTMQVRGSENKTYDCNKLSGSWCHGAIDLPEDYDPFLPPTSELSRTVPIYFSFRTDGTDTIAEAVKRVDDRRMVIMFEPTIMLIWEDSRIQLRNFSGFPYVPLPDTLISKIWAPRLTAYHRRKRTNAFRDPGNYSREITPLIFLMYFLIGESKYIFKQKLSNLI